MDNLQKIVIQIFFEEEDIDNIVSDALKNEKSESKEELKEAKTLEVPTVSKEMPDETEELITKLFASSSFTQNLNKVLSEDRTFLKKIFKKIKIGVQK